MIEGKIADKLHEIYKELSALSNEIASKLDQIEKKPDLGSYLVAIKKCHASFNASLAILGDSSEFYQKGIEIKDDDHNSLDYIRHDMINPLSGIRGYSELTLEKTADSSVEEIISISNRMLDLVTHIRDSL